jgi:peptidyl-prolyl cis-trans isomerase D
MLDLMRRKKRLKAVLWLVIISLALGMLLLFVPGANVGNVSFDASAASVDGDSIPMKELIDAYTRAIRNYSAGGRNKTDPETLKALGFGRQALDSLINMRVVTLAAKKLGLDVTPEEIRQAVETNPNLQDSNGFIGVERYKALLEANNISVSEFEEGVRYMLLSKKIRNVVSDSVDVSEKDIRNEFKRMNQEAQVSFVIFKKDDFRKDVKPTDAELQAYFDAHKDNYRIKEQRRAQYLLIPLQSLAGTIPVTEQELQDEWAREGREETVDAAHILFKVPDPSKDAEVKAKAEAILKRARAGEDFAELARKYSEDTGSAKQGGDLGPFPRGRMVKEFEDVAFALKPGEISDLVRTQFGYHIIKVLRHDIPTLQEYRKDIERAVQLNRASELIRKKAAEADQLVAKEKDFNALGKALKVPFEIKETGLLTKDSDAYTNGVSPEFLNELFQLKEIGSIGKAVPVPQGYAIPKLVQTVLPKPPDFTEARPRVEKDYIEAKQGEFMEAEAKRFSEEASKLGDLEKAAKQDKLTAKTSASFKIDGSPDSEIGNAPQFNSEAFQLPVGKVSGPIQLDGGKRVAVLQVKSRTPFDEAAFNAQRSSIRTRMLMNVQDLYFEQYIRGITEQLEKAGKIRVNPKAVEQLAGLRY